MATRKLEVQIIGDSRSLERAFARSQKAADKFGRTTGTMGGRLDQTAKKFGNLQTAFVGGIAFTSAVAGIRSVVTAAAESQQVLGQTKVALEATGNSWSQYGRQIEDVIKKQSRLGFDDEALLRTFSLFVRTTGDVNQALRLNALAADVSRGRYIGLEQAAQLVNKAAIGQAGALRRLGIDVSANATAQQLLTALTAKYGGAAQAASNDATTAMDRVTVSTENLRESIGTLLLPAITLLADDLAAAADVASDLVDGLHKIGATKIPRIEIPFGITVGGQSVGSLAGRAAGFLKFTPLNPLFGVTIANAIAQQFRDQADAATPGLANQFAETINTMTQNALDTSASTTTPAAPTVKGFGTGLTPKDLFGPLIKQIPASLQEALLDAQISGSQTKIRGVLVRILGVMTKALDDPRLKRPGRIAIKTIIDSIKGQIASIDSAFAAASDAASSARASKAATAASKRAAAIQKIAAANKAAAIAAAAAAKAQAAAAKTAEQSRQFRAIGLDATGNRPPPTIENLRKQLRQLSARSDLGATSRTLLKRIRKVLVDPIRKATPETRNAIDDLFDTIRQGFDQGNNKLQGPLTKTTSLNTKAALANVTGLNRDQIKQIRANLSNFNSAGRALAGSQTGAVNVNVVSNVTMDGQTVARNVTKHQQKATRRNPPQKRGPNRRGGV